MVTGPKISTELSLATLAVAFGQLAYALDVCKREIVQFERVGGEFLASAASLKIHQAQLELAMNDIWTALYESGQYDAYKATSQLLHEERMAAHR